MIYINEIKNLFYRRQMNDEIYNITLDIFEENLLKQLD